MSLYQRVLGHPFVYQHIRPLAVGGVDHSASYALLGATRDDVVLDVGCGTGDAMKYLGAVNAYRGYDTDPVAIEFAKRRAREAGSKFQFEVGLVDENVVTELGPTRVMLCGLLHHLADDEAIQLLDLFARAPTVKRIVTVDTVFLPQKLVNNFFARLDRGKFVRDVSGFCALVERSGLVIATQRVVRSHPTRGLVEYLVLALEPRR